jgi:hypothetical protein
MSSEDASSEEQLQQLLERWDDLRRQGREPTVEELCGDCPAFRDELQRRIAALRATNWLEKPE